MAEVVTSLAAVFVTAAALLLVANRFSLSTVPFYIVAGLLAGTVVEQGELVELAQWGIAFLVFVFGTRVDLEALQSVLRDGELAAFAQLLVVGPLAFGAGLLFGLDAANALYVAIAGVLSSTLVGGGALEADIRDDLVHGRLASSIHLFDDLVAIVLVLVLSADAFTADAVAAQLGYGVCFLFAAIVVHRHGYSLLGRLAGNDEELLLMGTISILIAFLAGAELAGVSVVVGAFAAGIAIHTEGPETLSVRNGVRSIRDFFVAIFFVTVGALVTLPGPRVLVLAAVIVGFVSLITPAVLLLAFGYEGYDARTSFLASTSLNQVSELSLVIAIQALLLSPPAIDEAVFEAIILAAATTMILTAVTRKREEVLFRRIVEPLAVRFPTRKIDERSDVDAEIDGHVVVAGYGRHGRHLVDACERHDREYVVVENDPARWNELQGECRNYVLGDAMSRYTWELAAVDRADLIVSTIDARPVSESILDLETDADAILRSSSPDDARDLLDRGALFVGVPDVLAAEELVECVETVVEEPARAEELRAEQLHRFDDLERAGFGARLHE